MLSTEDYLEQVNEWIDNMASDYEDADVDTFDEGFYTALQKVKEYIEEILYDLV